MDGTRIVTRFNDLFLYLAYHLIHLRRNSLCKRQSLCFQIMQIGTKKCQDTADTDVTIDPTCLELDYL